MEFEMDCVQSFISAMPTGVNELCCHPGLLSDDPLLSEPDFRVVRPKELEFFTNPALSQALQRREY